MKAGKIISRFKLHFAMPTLNKRIASCPFALVIHTSGLNATMENVKAGFRFYSSIGLEIL